MNIQDEIKVSVSTQYEGSFYKKNILYYAFSYHIKIENFSEDTVQLKRRHWRIKDSLQEPLAVSGDGVIGETPKIPSKHSYSYSSGCIIRSSLGCMEGEYTFLHLKDNYYFDIAIPRFQLIVPSKSN